MESFDAVAVGMRAAAFVGALQAAGLALFISAPRTTLTEDASPLVSLARSMTLAGLALVLGHQVVEAARLAGDWSGLVDFDIQWGNWHRSPGVSALVGAAGLAIEYSGFCLTGALSRILPVLGALGVVASFALTGHTTHPTVSPLIRLLLVLHVAIVGYWLGSIVALVRLTRVATTHSLCKVSSGFSASAVWVVPAILPIGVGVAIGVLPNLAALWTVYGALLTSKVSGFAVLLALAAFNRWRVVPALEREPLVATRRFRRSLHAEYLLLVSVLSVTAVMTSLYSWH
jgi:putative copper resistance protein D